jgi:alpha-N-arabinofuranosidase
MSIRRFCISCLLAAAVGGSLPAAHARAASPDDAAAAPAATASVTIRADGPRTAYSRLLFGGFIEHFGDQVYGGIFDPGSPLADEAGFRRDVVEAVKELKISVVRWPGGCFASGYHWRDGVGPDRRGVPDPVWGVVDSNAFGTDEFVAWCRRVGCEPYICTNAGNGTPDEMRQWVEYCNAKHGPLAELRGGAPHNVRYWSIGNENWGGHEIGAKTPAEWGPLVRTSADMMRAVDPSLTLLAAATPNRGWSLPLLQAAGDRLDAICIHEYWLPLHGRHQTPDYLSCIMQSEGPEQTIARTIDILEEAGLRGRITIAFDEWNLRAWHHPGFPRKEPVAADDAKAAELVDRRKLNDVASQYTMADALFAASFMNACLRHAGDVDMANIAPLVNTRGPLFVHREGLVKRTTFHVLALYATQLEQHVVEADVAAKGLEHGGRSIPVVDAIATVDEAGSRCALALVNRHPTDAIDCLVRWGDELLEGGYEAVTLAGDSPDAFNDVENPRRVEPVAGRLQFTQGRTTLPPHSLTILKKVPATKSR